MPRAAAALARLVLALVAGAPLVATRAGAIPPDAVALGPCADTEPVDGLVLAFAPRDPQGLAAVLAAPRAPFIGPDEFGARFGADAAAYDAAEAWLRAAGFTGVRRWPNRLALSFAGDAGTVATALAAPLDAFAWRGERHHVPTRAASVPRFAGIRALGVLGLDSFAQLRPLLGVGGQALLAPADVARAYGLEQPWAAGTTGAGVDIAVVASSDFDVADVFSFRSAAGLGAPDVQKHFVSTSPGVTADLPEALLDVSWSGAVAPGARVTAVIGGGSRGQAVIEAVQAAINGNLAPVVSISFGACEPASTTVFAQFFDTLFQQAAAQGQSVIVASGDDGAGDCGATLRAQAVNVLAASPWVTAVGGTQLDPGFDANGDATGWTGEVAWNDVAGASGGGRSTVFTKPSWQRGAGVPDDGARDVPDVAAAASPLAPGYLLVVNGQPAAVGGTSAAAPVWAGMAALLVQARGGPLGLLSPELYRVGAAQAAGGAAAFHDVVQGDNTFGGVPGFPAGPGYDLVSGWGSFDAASLLVAYGSVRACTTDGDCDDGDGCTADRCTPAGCTESAQPDGLACSPSACVPGTCASGACVATGPAGCDDGDVCTDDACAASGCTHGPARGAGAVVCVLGSAGSVAAACPGETLPKRITSHVRHATRLLERTARARPRRARQLVHAARRELTAARRAVKRAHRLSPACATSLGALLDGAVSRTRRLVGG